MLKNYKIAYKVNDMYCRLKKKTWLIDKCNKLWLKLKTYVIRRHNLSLYSIVPILGSFWMVCASKVIGRTLSNYPFAAELEWHHIWSVWYIMLTMVKKYCFTRKYLHNLRGESGHSDFAILAGSLLMNHNFYYMLEDTDLPRIFKYFLKCICITWYISSNDIITCPEWNGHHFADEMNKYVLSNFANKTHL